MKRSLILIVMVCLAGGFSSACFAQDRAAGDSNKLTREEWQSRVNATRERLQQRREELRRDREKRLEPRRQELRREQEKKKDLRRGLS